jgi:hypothetical protein
MVRKILVVVMFVLAMLLSACGEAQEMVCDLVCDDSGVCHQQCIHTTPGDGMGLTCMFGGCK